LGVGYIARHLATPALAEGRLVARQVADAKPAMPLHLAWHSGQPGKALKWFVKRLSEPDFAAGLLGPTAAAASRAAPSRRPARRATVKEVA